MLKPCSGDKFTSSARVKERAMFFATWVPAKSQSAQGKMMIENLENAIAPAAQANNRVIELALAHKQDEA
jgi:hypothetical protein